MKSSVKKGIDVLKANPHQLLASSKEVAMPTEEEIRGAVSPAMLHKHLEIIESLKNMHRDDYDLYYQLEDLEIAALERAYELAEEDTGHQELAS